MGTYPPRECGIATFNQDLLSSSQLFLGESVACKVAAMNVSSVDTHIYPQEVEWEIDQNNPQELTSLATSINRNPAIHGVIIQHEYGIYGGNDGENFMAFIDACRKPMVITLHTILPNPSLHMKQITDRIISRARILVVLTYNSQQILEKLYPGVKGKIHVIPHGIHATKFSGTSDSKAKLDLKGALVISTFGLLSRGKGIEYVIKSLPVVIKQHPELIYLILGETHPVVRRLEGESYRNELAEMVNRLGLKHHVRFYNQYLSLPQLLEFLKATDIYISPSINPHQAVSGTLSYALGTGRAVISTTFSQAKEIITPDTGRLVRMKDPAAFSQALLELSSNQLSLKKMHRRAYDITRPMLWSSVAQTYTSLLSQYVLPQVNLSHLEHMTDDFGLFQFANLGVPDKSFGYTLDDNARAMVVSRQLKQPSFKKYLNFIKHCQQADGSFINYISFSQKKGTVQNQQEDLEDASARAMWALSEILADKSTPSASRKLALQIFLRAGPHTQVMHHIRSSAYIIKAYANMAKNYPEKMKDYLQVIQINAQDLVKKLRRNSVKSWRWFDTYLGYNNAVMPEALLIAGKICQNLQFTDKGKQTLHFLIEKTFSLNHYIPIGHSQWYENRERRSTYDQQPEDPAAMILALETAYNITLDEQYLRFMTVCFSWFLGNNNLHLPLYNFKNGGCYDGLQPDRVNLNQGAESQVSYLMSRLAVEKVSLS